MKTNLKSNSRASILLRQKHYRGQAVESREQSQTANRRAGTAVPIRHLGPASRLSQPATCNLQPATGNRAPLETAAGARTFLSAATSEPSPGSNKKPGLASPRTLLSQNNTRTARVAGWTGMSALRPNSRPTLANTDGFWQLTFDGRSAVLKQHPALFYVAWLLAKAPAAPVTALDLAGYVFRRFRSHQDLLRCARWLCRQQCDGDVAEVFRKKQRALEKILDGPGETEVEKIEAQRELIFLEHLLETYFIELIPPGEKTAERIASELLDLYASLAAALDAQGNPHPVIRAFALHLLVCVVMPSIRASRGAVGARYVYRSLESKV